LAELFKTPTIRGLSAYIKSRKQGLFTPIEPGEKKDYHTLSSAQKRLYILHQMDEGSTSYNMPYALRLEGEVNKNELEEIFLRLIARHESLRTSFWMLDGVPAQRIHRDVEFEIEYDQSLVIGQWSLENCQGRGEVTSPIKIEEITRIFIRPFDLSHAPLLRVRLIKESDQKHILIVDMHHIISDGISRRLLVKEFMALTAGKDLPPLRLQYKDFSAWQNSEAQRETQIKQKAYWKKQLGGDIPVLDLPVDYVRPTIQRFEGSTVAFAIDQEELNALQSLALAEGMTLYMILLGIYYILLFKLSNQEDILVGTPTVGRRHADLEQIIGMFVNTLVLRNYPIGDKTYRGFLKEIKKRSLQAFENQDYPYEELVEEMAITRDASRNPLFDTMFVMQNMGEPRIEIPNLKLTPDEHQVETSKFDLTLIGMEKEERLLFTFEYSTNLFKKAAIERFVEYFKKIVSVVAANPDVKIGKVEILVEDEKRQVLYDFNDTTADYPKDKLLHELFEEQSEKNPDRIAVIGPAQSTEGDREPWNRGHTITYRELNEKFNQLAYGLRAKGVVFDTIVGIMAERSLDMIIGILGILKAGGAYLPVDLEYPHDRIRYMLADSGANLLLTTGKLAQEDKKFRNLEVKKGIEIILIDSFENTNFSSSYLPNFSNTRPSSLAYVIYTSGTTGKPKGTLTTHTNVIRVVKNTNYIDLTARDRVLQLSNYAFDGSVFDIYGALLSGAVLVMIEKESILSVDKLSQTISREMITVFFVTTALFNALTDMNIRCLSRIRKVLFGGERISVEHSKTALEYLSKDKIIHVYGPTETTVYATYYPIDRIDETCETIPIGSPISNTTTYIVDKYGQLAPIGVHGELLIGGDGTARGYLNEPELTNEKFIRDPFTPGQRLYRSGDIVRWLKDGSIEFIGRVDHQVKIRGFRVETGEIEHQLLQHNKINESLVVARENNGDRYLCAYVVSDEKIEAAELRDFLSDKLPGYMVPASFVWLDKFPLTLNGKIDRKALPVPEYDSGVMYMAPRNPIEEKMVEIWREVLGTASHEYVTIGIDDNFFQLGGHSLKATILASKIHQVLNVRVPLAEIFTNPTIRELHDYIERKEKERYASIEKAENKEYYCLSSAQKRMFLLYQIDPTGTAYNIPLAVILEGILKRTRLEGAFKRLIHRHESLRTSFDTVGEEPVQRIHDHVEFEIEYFGAERKEQRHAPCAVRHASFIRPFDLSHTPLLRVALIPLHTPPFGHPSEEGNVEDKHLLLVDMHHIISDGTSMGVLVREFMRLYSEEELPPLRSQYKDFSRWQNSKKEQESIKQQESYWLEEFAGEIPVLNLPVDFPRPAIQDFAGRSSGFEIGKGETQKLKNLAMTEGATLYMVLLTLFNVFLARLSGQEEIIVGSPVAGRRHPDLEPIIGMFVNTMALRNYPSGEKTIKELIGEIKAKTLEAQENQDYPFEDLVENVTIDRDAGRNPLFDVMFILQNIDIEELKIPGLKLAPYPYDSGISKFDITLYCEEAGEHLYCSIEYTTSLFKDETIKRMIGYFKKITAMVSQNSQIRISGIEIIPGEEKKQLLFDFNDTEIEYPQDKTIYQLFAEQVRKTPDHIAVVGAHTNELAPVSTPISITYRELNNQSHQLTRILRKNGVGPEILVGIMVERSARMLIGILAILNAGGAYLPIDPEYPEERVRYMLLDSNVEVLLTVPVPRLKAKAEIKGKSIKIIDISNRLSLLASNLSSTPGRAASAANLAYVIYTSGSTGKPKGVTIEHSPVINVLSALHREYPFLESDVYLFKTPVLFDVSVTELFGWFLGGGRVVLLENGAEKDPERIIDSIKTHFISHINFVPSMFGVFLTLLKDKPIETLPGLKYIFLAGEALPSVMVKEFRNIAPGTQVKLENIYGPTEGTVYTTGYSLSQWDGSENIPIGRPLNNIKTYIFSNYDGLQPIGLAGELCIGGVGLARGYLNQPQLTDKNFINHPYLEGERIYRTGDLARWLPESNIEFLGRIDQQVKIRGFRIELGEIESQLRRRDEIKEAVVLAREDKNGEKYLCAYIVLGKKLAIPELRGYLSQYLPDFMIPSYFVMLDRIPLTPNGKIDRSALPAAEIDHSREYIAPRDELESKLAEIWKEVLLLSVPIGIDDHFFQLGGHSLKAVTLLSKIHQAFDVKLPLAEMFKRPSIRRLSQYIREAVEEQYRLLEAAEKKEYYPLSSAQKRLFIIQQMNPTAVAYNLPHVMILEGRLNEKRLEKSLMKLIKRHESLRTSFKIIGGEPVQRIHPGGAFEIEYHIQEPLAHSLEQDKELYASVVNAFIRPFKLTKAPLLRVRLIKIDREKHLLMFDMHHIITDGISMYIFVREFMALIAGEDLPSTRLQYKDFSQWQQREKKNANRKQQEAFWLSEFSGQIPLLKLPCDFSRPAVRSFAGDCIDFELGKKDTRALMVIAQEEGVTLYMVLLSIFNILLYRLSGQEDIVVGTALAGRPQEFQHTIGMFVSTLALRGYPSGRLTFREFLNDLKKRTIRAFDHQDYPFEELVEKVADEWVNNRHPLFDVVFNLQNQDITELRIPGLTLVPYPYKNETAKFDLILIGYESEDILRLTMEYSTELFKPGTIARFIRYYKDIAAAVITCRDIHLSDIHLSFDLAVPESVKAKEMEGDFGF
jgi:amino acid adenylation domain-containing protein